MCVDCAATPVVDGVEITTSFFSLRQVYSLGFANLSSSVRPAAQRSAARLKVKTQLANESERRWGFYFMT